MKKFIIWCLPLLLSTLVVPWAGLATPSAAEQVAYQPLPKPGAKATIDADHYFIYGFDKQPKLGATVMRVEIFSWVLVAQVRVAPSQRVEQSRALVARRRLSCLSAGWAAWSTRVETLPISRP